MIIIMIIITTKDFILIEIGNKHWQDWQTQLINEQTKRQSDDLTDTQTDSFTDTQTDDLTDTQTDDLTDTQTDD